MNNGLQKTEIPGISKAGEGILINTDNDGLRAYKNRKLKERKIEELDMTMHELKKDMAEIKELLKGLVK
jgi:hypothetical protein